MLVALLFGIFLFLIVLEMPLAHAMLVAIIATLVIGFNIPLTELASGLIAGADQWLWMTIPLFLLMGNLMNASGVTDRLIAFSQEIVGHISGGLSHVGVATNTLMAGMSGCCAADAAITGTIMIPAMKKAGYPAGYASMLIASSANIAELIPPSVGLIIVGVIGRLSILRLWFSGVVPGFILGLGLLTTGYIMAKRKGFPRLERKPSFKRIVKTGGGASAALAIPVFILGGMRLGVFSAIEAGAVGVVYTVLVGIAVYRTLNLTSFKGAVWDATRLLGPIIWIIAVAILFGQVLGRLNVGPAIADFLVGISPNPLVFIVVISVVVLLIGCIMEGTPIILIVYPLLIPAANAYGIDPIYFAQLFFYCLVIGQCTPPMATSMFICNAIAKSSVADYAREGWPLLITQFLLVPLLIFFPALITWFPNLIMGAL